MLQSIYSLAADGFFGDLARPEDLTVIRRADINYQHPPALLWARGSQVLAEVGAGSAGWWAGWQVGVMETDEGGC